MVYKYLRVSHYDQFRGSLPADRRRLEKFIRNKLKADGILLLRFISGHAGDLLTMELADRLFRVSMMVRKFLEWEESDSILGNM